MIGWALRWFALTVLAVAALAVMRPADKELVGGRLGGRDQVVLQEPVRRTAKAPLELVIDRGQHGHFLVDAHINGAPMTLLVDTGASHIILNEADARRAGFATGRLDFRDRFQSANGEIKAAPVTLRELRIGQFQLHDLDAYVKRGPLDISLLGMSFLNRLESYEASAGRLVLRW